MAVYIETPISELPDKEGNYTTVSPTGITINYFNGKYFEIHLSLRNHITHWLKPVKLQSLVQDESIKFLEWVEKDSSYKKSTEPEYWFDPSSYDEETGQFEIITTEELFKIFQTKSLTPSTIIQ